MERLTYIEKMRLYNMRASGPLVEKPEIDQALHKRGLIEEYSFFESFEFDGESWRAYNITKDGLQLLELEEEMTNTITVFPEQLPAIKEDDYYEWRIDEGDERYFCRRDCATKIWTYEVGFEDEDNDEGWTYEPTSYADLPDTVKATKLYTIGKNSTGSWSLVRIFFNLSQKEQDHETES